VTRKIALLANPAAGRGRSHVMLDPVIERLGSAGAQVEVLQARDAQDALDLARKAVADGVDTLAALGGDGMIHLAVQALANSQTALGVVPMGTGNDFARSLGLPEDPLAAAGRVAGDVRRTIDVARSGDRYFATVMAAGFDAAVNERANNMRWPHGDLRYTIAAIAVLGRWRAVPYTFEIDGEERQVEAMLVCVANTDSYGGGLRIPWGALPDDGLLDVIVIRPTSKLEFLRVLPTVRSGKHVNHPAFERIRARRVTIAAPRITAYADGEPFGSLPLTVECVPGGLTVLT
jgi:diacylglycerol kinase (ATP)